RSTTTATPRPSSSPSTRSTTAGSRSPWRSSHTAASAAGCGRWSSCARCSPSCTPSRCATRSASTWRTTCSARTASCGTARRRMQRRAGSWTVWCGGRARCVTREGGSRTWSEADDVERGLTVHAIVLREFGPPGVLRLERVADPEPAAGQLHIAVTAAGVHRIDAWVRAGIESPATLPLPALPWVPGREVAGVVDAVGPGVDPGWLGRRVVAHLGPAAGGYAERAVCAEDAALVIPEGVGDDVAVAMIGTGRTALGVLDVARVERGAVALVTGAAGGAGSLLVQHLHRVAGATVVAAVGGAAKVEHAGEDGADVVVDYSEPGWTRAVRDALEDGAVSLVLDGVGGRVGRDAFELLGAGGRFVFFGWASGT